MDSSGRERRGRPRGTGQAPPSFDQSPTFDQKTFAKVVEVVAAAFARASATVGHGGHDHL